MKALAVRSSIAASIALGIVAFSALSSTQALAAGAQAQSPVTQAVLEQQWNGQQGLQQTATSGVLAQWHANELGESSRQSYTPSAWGAPAKLTIEEKSTDLSLAQRQAKAITHYRPAAWGAPAQLVVDQTQSSFTVASTSNSALKMHR